MSAKEKSDLPEVAEKRANKAASAAAELVERRGGAKENAELQSTVRTQSREAVSQAQARIREAVTRNRQDKLTALLHGCDAERSLSAIRLRYVLPGDGSARYAPVWMRTCRLTRFASRCSAYSIHVLSSTPGAAVFFNPKKPARRISMLT